MIVSATTDEGQAVAFGKGHLGGVPVEVGAGTLTHRGPVSPKRHDPPTELFPTTGAPSFPKIRLTCGELSTVGLRGAMSCHCRLTVKPDDRSRPARHCYRHVVGVGRYRSLLIMLHR
jgi:hypothetical protein